MTRPAFTHPRDEAQTFLVPCDGGFVKGWTPAFYDLTPEGVLRVGPSFERLEPFATLTEAMAASKAARDLCAAWVASLNQEPA